MVTLGFRDRKQTFRWTLRARQVATAVPSPSAYGFTARAETASGSSRRHISGPLRPGDPSGYYY
eukprot:5496776-Prymnesium_polylepis.1